MDAPVRYESTQEPRDDEERELINPANWDWEDPIEGVIAENPRVSFEVSFTFEEHKRMARAAEAMGLHTIAFIQQAALDAARPASPELVSTPVNQQPRARRSG